MSALLSGAARYYALDAKPHARSLTKGLFDDLVNLFRGRAPIPGPQEFPNTAPTLKSYAFPSEILTPQRLHECLSDDRVDAIRRALNGSGGTREPQIQYIAPWHNADLIAHESIDMAYSQAVLEHVEDIRHTYRSLRKWVKRTGFMSHSIDFKSHGITADWNGHWTVGDLAWRIVKGKKPYLLNRLPLSAHLQEMRDAGFRDILVEIRSDRPMDRRKLAPKFNSLTDRDLSSAGVFVQAVPTH